MMRGESFVRRFEEEMAAAPGMGSAEAQLAYLKGMMVSMSERYVVVRDHMAQMANVWEENAEHRAAA
jgi:hypothetical protein